MLSDSDPTTENSGRKEGECHPCHPRSLRQEEYKVKVIQGYRVRPYLMVGGKRIFLIIHSPLFPLKGGLAPLCLWGEERK